MGRPVDAAIGLLARATRDPSLTTNERLDLVEQALRDLELRAPGRPDIHWEDGTEGAHYAAAGCCKFGPEPPCKNQLRFEKMDFTSKSELLYEDGTCRACGARYHCVRCKHGVGMYGHWRDDQIICTPLPPPPERSTF